MREREVLFHQQLHDCVEMLVGEPAQLVVGAVLHRMRDEYQGRVGAERFSLRLRSLNELGRRDADRRNATLLEVRHVMRTARYARPSVAEAFDDQIDLAGDLLLQRQGRRAGVGRLLVALDRDAALPEPLVEAVEEYIAARLGDVEDADRQTVEPLRPRQARPYRRISLRCRVEKHRHGLTSLVTGTLPRGPPADQPPMMPENIPALPPARTIIRPPGRNLLTVLPASEAGPPSAMPLAPAISSSPGISHSL